MTPKKYNCASPKTCRVVKVFLFCSILEIVYKIVQATDGHSQAFSQAEEREIRYLVDGISFKMQNTLSSDNPSVSFTELEDETLRTFSSPIIFQPPTLDFGIHPVIMPRLERVYILNPSDDTSLHLLSISGSSVHFHCSFFQEKIIPPGGNTSFDVVFLAREENQVENTLFIHTSLGSFKYQVTAIGAANPYRLQPFLGVRMPVNSSFSPLIHMHNPHSGTIQVTEIYSSGGDLHLELPLGESVASKLQWTVQPYETRTVMRANFVARVERNHTAYIRIKTNNSEDYLVVPVEVEVSSAPGIYSPSSVLDFGVLRSQDEPKTISISLLNSGQKHVHVVNTIVAPVNDAIDIKFSPLKIPPDTLHSTEVANITFFPSRASHQKQCTGRIVIKTKNNQYKLTIPYQVVLLQGSLDFNSNSTRFYMGHESGHNVTHVRQFSVINNFNATLVIHGVSQPSEVQHYFSINFSLPVFLPPGKSTVLGWVVFNPPENNLQLTTYVRLFSNVSYFDIPFVCFSGKLQLFLPQGRDRSQLDFGTLGLGEKRSLIFAVINENPVDVDLRHWGSNTSKTYVELVGLNKGNISTLARRHTFSDLTQSMTLKPHHYAIFRVGITASSEEGVFFGETFLETQYEVMKIPYTIRTAKGSLIADDLFFDNAFPGKISSQPLYIKSTFAHPLTVTSVVAVPEDARFIFEPSRISSTLQPGIRNLVGKVFFDPRRDCRHKCYSGLPTTSPMGHHWLLGMNLLADVGDMDGELYKNLRERWQSTISSGEKSMNITFQLDTTEVHGFFIKAHATMHWPRLSNKCHLRFPVTQINNITVKDFAIENPSSLPVLVQILPLHLYPSPELIIRMLAHRLGGESVALKHVDNLDTVSFTLQDLEEFDPRADNPIPAYRKSLEEYFGVSTNKQTITMLLTPGMRVRVRVGFNPQDSLSRTSLILIRNNLTVMDALVVQGQGGTGQFQFGSREPGTDSSLVFKLNEKHLKDCEDSRNSKFMQPKVTVRRSFVARNTGDLPIYIHRFDINGRSCEGYGFRVLHCEGFEMKPNTSRKVDIAYTPDFTLSRVERVLNLHTSLGYAISYILVATVPRHLLASCSKTMPRPNWESLLYYSIVSLLLFLLFCILTAAYLEGDRIVQATFFPMTTSDITFDPAEEQGQLFDLKLFNKSADELDRFAFSSLEEQETSECNDEMEWPADNLCSSVFSDGKGKEKDIQCNEVDFEEEQCEVSAQKSHQSIGTCTSFSSSVEGDEVQRIHSDSDSTDVLNPANVTWTQVLLNSFSFRNSKTTQEQKSNAATQTVHEAKSEEPDSLEMDCNKQNPTIRSRSLPYDGKPKFKGQRGLGKNVYLRGCPKISDGSSWEEETSSTTTESSNPESDISEKDHHLPDVCIPANVVKHKTRSKTYDETTSASRTKTSSPSVKVDEKKGGREDQDFELSTKSKAHKKIKVDPTKVFGGDILRPSTLELPYKPQNVMTSKDKNMNTEPSASSSVSYKPGNAIRIASNKSKDDSLYEISQETEKFALHLGMEMASNRLRSLSDDNATYSAIVSGESPDVSWKMPPPTEYRKAEWGKYLGSPSARPSSLPLKSDVGCGVMLPNRIWKLPVSSHERPTYSDPNMLPSSCDPDNIFPLGNLPSIGAIDSDDGDITDIFPSTWTPQHVSVMQDLQAKRRQRLDEYYKQQALSNWPGFNTPSPEASFWDPSCIPAGENWIRDNLPRKSSNEALSKDDDHLWASRTDSFWSPSSSVWSPGKLSSSLDFPSTSTASCENQNRNSTGTLIDNCELFERNSNIETIKPMDNLSSIWSPNVKADSNSIWRFGLFPDSNTHTADNGDKKTN